MKFGLTNVPCPSLPPIAGVGACPKPVFGSPPILGGQLWLIIILRKGLPPRRLYRGIHSQLRPIQATLRCGQQRGKTFECVPCPQQLDLGSLWVLQLFRLYRKKRATPRSAVALSWRHCPPRCSRS